MDRHAEPRGWSDRELLTAIAGIDREAFTALYRRHLSAVLAFLVQETGDSEIAADLTAEVFAAVMLAARRYQPQHESAVADQGRGDVERLLASLSADERDAVRARVVAERSYAEIAAELRCSELVVRKRVSRGLGRLREQIEERQ
jgi:RNA polymerase sigma-70 factor (ECF subfamily)